MKSADYHMMDHTTGYHTTDYYISNNRIQLTSNVPSSITMNRLCSILADLCEDVMLRFYHCSQDTLDDLTRRYTSSCIGLTRYERECLVELCHHRNLVIIKSIGRNSDTDPDSWYYVARSIEQLEQEYQIELCACLSCSRYFP